LCRRSVGEIIPRSAASPDNASDGIQVTNSTTNVIDANRLNGNALGINETGTSDNNIYAGNNATGNTSDTSILANDGSVVAANRLGGTRNITAAASLDLWDYTDYFAMSGATAVTSIEASWVGRVVQIRSSGATQINNAGNIVLFGSVNQTLADTDVITLVCDGTNWYQVAPKSVN